MSVSGSANIPKEDYRKDHWMLQETDTQKTRDTLVKDRYSYNRNGR